ncbi:Mettl7b [Symbiodinium sp. CCMP2592]|nr:Mettl7b [Symbiodinium sp. CCMP2592]
MALLLSSTGVAERTSVPQHPAPARQSLPRTSTDPRLPRSWLLAAVPLTAATCRVSRHQRCQTLRKARAPEADSETPRRVALTVLGTAVTVTGVDAAFRASDERYAALGTILAPAPYKETLRTELVPGRIWGFEQCIALASVSTNIRMTAVKLRDGGLWVSAPIAPTRQCLRLLDELGKVAHLVIPSTALEHKASIAEFSRAYPKAEIWVTPGQAPPITVPSNSRILGQGPAPVWADELDCKIFYVSPPITDTFAEAVFFHKETRSLLVTDCALKLPSAAPKILESYGYDGTPGPISLDQWRYKAIAFDFVTGRNQDEKDFAALSRPAALVNPLLRFIVYRRCPEQAAAGLGEGCCQAQGGHLSASFRRIYRLLLIAHQLNSWRRFTQMSAGQDTQRKFDKCASAVALYEQKMSDYDAWRDRVMEAPRTELARRRDWLTSQQGHSLASSSDDGQLIASEDAKDLEAQSMAQALLLTVAAFLLVRLASCDADAAPNSTKVGMKVTGQDNSTSSSINGTNGTGILEEVMDIESRPMFGMVLGGLVAICAVISFWQCFKWLTGPKRTPAPLLADTELTEGDPVHGDQPTGLWMGGTGPARELMSGTSAGFTQF